MGLGLRAWPLALMGPLRREVGVGALTSVHRKGLGPGPDPRGRAEIGAQGPRGCLAVGAARTRPGPRRQVRGVPTPGAARGEQPAGALCASACGECGALLAPGTRLHPSAPPPHALSIID